jgi:hypothetical protein
MYNFTAEQKINRDPSLKSVATSVLRQNLSNCTVGGDYGQG